MRPEVISLRKNVHDFILDTIFQSNPTPPVLEIGPMQLLWTPVKEYFVDTRAFFKGKGVGYSSCDTDPKSGADIISDVLSLSQHIEDNSVGAIIALEVLEHVSEIWKVPDIFHKILKPGGKVFVSVPYYFYRHAPFPDYWRISEDGLTLLFKEKFDISITPLVLDDERKPLQYTLVGIKK